MKHEVRVPDKVTSVNAISDVKSKQERTSKLVRTLTKLNVVVICQAQIFREEKQLFVPFTFGYTE